MRSAKASDSTARLGPASMAATELGYLLSIYASPSDAATPSCVSDPEQHLELGGLWRDVVNFLGDEPVEPRHYLALLRKVLPRWSTWTGFLGYAARRLTTDRAELEADAARSELAWRIWTDRRDALLRHVQRVAKRHVSEQELRDWWVGDGRAEWAYKLEGKDAAAKFAKSVGLTDAEEWVIEYHPDIPHYRGKTVADLEHDWILHWLHGDLVWVEELESLRAIARKTWTADAAARVAWSKDELKFVNSYFEEQLPSLYVPGDPEEIDPFDLDTETWDQSLGFPLDGLRYCFVVLTRAAVVDFADEVLERNRHPTRRGSLRCVDCGTFVGRRALGYGQLYCSSQCKKRAAKRRYRARTRMVSRGGIVPARCTRAPARDRGNDALEAAVA